MSRYKISGIFFQSISGLGTPFFYIPVIAYLRLTGSPLAIMLAIAVIVIEAVGAAIKLRFPTNRPIPMPRKTIYQKYDAGSFPSIHTARVTATMVFIGAAHLKAFVVVAGALLSLFVGYSRIYLKKHRLADVAGGLFLGLLVSSGVLWVMR